MDLRKLTIMLGIGLFLSLSANMFLAGVMMGRAVSPPVPAGAIGAVDTGWAKKDKDLRQNLSPKDREAVKAAMEGVRGRFQALRTELEAAQESVRQATNAEPFDQAALDAALRAEKEKKMEMLREMRQVKQGAMQNLSPEGQAVLQRFGQGGGEGAGRKRFFQRQRQQHQEGKQPLD